MENEEIKIDEVATVNDEAKIFRENPSLASEELQRKYLGMVESDWVWEKSFDGACPDGFKELTKILKNPFIGEEREIRYLEMIPQKTVQERIDELKQKVAIGTATTTEKADLKLLLG